MSAPSPPAVAVPDGIETSFGPLVSGIWVQQLLLGFILAQMVDYYRQQWQKDSIFNRIIVTLLLVLNILLGGTDFHVLYRAAVLYYGNLDMFDLQEWTMWTEPMWTAVVGFIAQVFFLNRCHKITRSTVLTVILSILVLFSFGSGLAVSASFIEKKRFSSLGQFKLPITLWLISTTVADVALAACIIFSLYRSRTLFKKTNTVLTRIIVTTMETSGLTALIAILNLVLFLPLQETALHLLPQFSMSRVYTLTVMVTLLARSELRDVLNSTGHQSINTTHLRDTKGDGTPIRVGVTRTVEHDQHGKHQEDSDIELGERPKISSWDTKGAAL